MLSAKPQARVATRLTLDSTNAADTVAGAPRQPQQLRGRFGAETPVARAALAAAGALSRRRRRLRQARAAAGCAVSPLRPAAALWRLFVGSRLLAAHAPAGGTRFIGVYLARELLAAGHEARRYGVELRVAFRSRCAFR